MTAFMQSPLGVVDLPREERIDARLTGTSTDFERLYAEFMPRVRGLIRKLVPDAYLADDLVQETFLRAYNAGMQLEYHQAHPEHTQWPWLAAVARNLCLDVLRKNGAAPEHVLEDEAVVIEALGDDPELHLLATRRRESIAEALCSVTERQRRILVMKCVEGKRYDEIAAAEGISVEALKSVLARARRTFRTSYAAIAERRGLGILVGGTWLRGLSSRLRSWRDRMTVALNDTAASFMAGGPAAINAVVTAVVLGGVAVVGTMFAPSAAAGEARPLGIAQAAASESEVVPVAQGASVSVAPSVETSDGRAETQGEGSAAVESAPPPEAIAEATAPVPSTTAASVDLDEAVPVGDPPAEGQAYVETGSDGTGALVDYELVVDTDADGEEDGPGQLGAGVDCANATGTVLPTACAVLDTAP